MARGKPAFWGTVIGGPVAALGVYTVASVPDVPDPVGFSFVLFGVFTVLTGLYVRRTAPEAKEFDEDERVIAEFQPNQLVAKAMVAVGFVFVLATVYLLFGTYLPYVYPTLTFSAFLVLTLSGLVRYWKNTLTTYYVTTKRISREYRLIEAGTQDIRLEKIAGKGRQQSAVDSLVNVGTVLLSAGGGNPKITEIAFRDIKEPERAIEAIDRAQRQYRNSDE